MGRRRVVPRFDIQPQRVARQQAAVLGIETALDNRAIAHTAHIERLTHRGVDPPGATDAPAHDCKPRDAVIVTHVRHDLLCERNRQRRIAAGDRQRHNGRGIGDDDQVQLWCGAFEHGAIGAQGVQLPGAAHRRRETAVDARAGHAQRFGLSRGFEPPHRAREWHARRAVTQHRRAGGQWNRIWSNEQRLIGASEIGRKARGECQVCEKSRESHLYFDLSARTATARRAQKEIGFDRADLLYRLSSGIEREQCRLPRLPRAASPQCHALGTGNRDRRLDGATTAHELPIDREPHRLVRIAPCAHRMPECRGTAGRGCGRDEEQCAGQGSPRTECQALGGGATQRSADGWCGE